jgi:hypothetical protein
MKREHFQNVRFGLLVALVVFSIGLFVVFKPAKASAFIGEGVGTENEPFLITNCDELQDIRSDVVGIYELTTNIDCTGVTFESVGDSGSPFMGSLNGNGYTISNLSIDIESDDSGLFGVAYSADIRNIRLDTVDMIAGNYTNIGALVGNANITTIEQIYAYDVGIVTANGENVGGLVGTLGGSTINRSSVENLGFYGRTGSSTNIGGLVGYMVGPSSISNTFTNGEIEGDMNLGGLIGQIGAGPTVLSNSYAAVLMSDGVNVDQLVGLGSAAFDSGVYESGDVGIGQTVDGWDFDTIWYVRPGNHPALIPSALPNMLCEEVISTDTSFNASCTTYPELEGNTTWELQYKADNHTDWIDLDVQAGPEFDVTVSSLLSGTAYTIRFRFIDNIGTGQWGTIQVTTTGDSDTDDDSSSNIEEASAPNEGDANDDNIQDSQQSNVISYLNPVSGNYSVFETNCSSIAGFQVGAESSQNPDSNYSYPFGLAGFQITCDNNGDTARIRQYYYGVEGSELYGVRKWRGGNTYQQIPAQNLGMPVNNSVVFLIEYNITDGGEFDDDGVANGIVVDPSGAALLSEQNSELASTGVNIWAYLTLAISVTLTGGALMIRQSSKTI